MGEETFHPELAGRIGRLIRLSTRSDDVRELAAAGHAELERALAVVDAEGAQLARAPAGGPGREALVKAQAASHHGGLAEHEDPDWLIVPLTAGERPIGYLAVRREPELSDSDRALLEALSSLLAGQLERAALATAIGAERVRALLRQLITDPAFTASNARDEIAGLGVVLAERYWPAILMCESGSLDEAVLKGASDLAHRFASESVVVPYDDRMAVVLLPDDGSHEEALRIVEQIVRFARRRLPMRGLRGIAGETSVALEEIPAAVRTLERLRRFPERESGALSVVDARRFALSRLFYESLDRPRALEFVRAQIGRVLAYDRAHNTDLAGILRIALDHPHRDEAARAAYMHRNTFRRHLNHAIELAGVDFNDPDERLALHVALRLRGLFESRQRSQGGGSASGGESASAPVNPDGPATR